MEGLGAPVVLTPKSEEISEHMSVRFALLVKFDM